MHNYRKQICIRNSNEIALLGYQKSNLTKNYGCIRKNGIMYNLKTNISSRAAPCRRRRQISYAATDRLVTPPPTG